MIKTTYNLKDLEFKYYRNSILFFLSLMHQFSFAQQINENHNLINEKSQCEINYDNLNDGFNFKRAYNSALLNNIGDEFIEEYVNHQHSLFLDSINTKHTHNHSNDQNYGKEVYFDADNKVLSGPNNPLSPLNSYCPNAGFELFNFSNWTGTIGKITTAPVGAPAPI